MKFDKFCSNHDQWAGGLIFNYDQAGDSKLSTTQVALNGSYTHRVNNNNFMTLGVQLSGYQRAFSTENTEERRFLRRLCSGGDFLMTYYYSWYTQGQWNHYIHLVSHSSIPKRKSE